MAQRVAAYGFDDASLPRSGADCALHYDLVQVMAAVCAGTRIDGNLGRGKHPLPSPVCGRVRILPV